MVCIGPWILLLPVGFCMYKAVGESMLGKAKVDKMLHSRNRHEAYDKDHLICEICGENPPPRMMHSP